ncbi:MAG: ADP-ribosylglycohydrolase family protein [Phycisphaeraceae bacterium]|nr:ADP-ribosylglycohydrolase family protein [Phycisphaeraceae bacterium]
MPSLDAITAQRGGSPARTLLLAIAVAVCSCARAQGPRLMDQEQYRDRLHAMWLGQVIANWTGRRTEGARINPPFYTDADWGTGNIQWVLQDPWLADDDTDVEYVYLHLMTQHATTRLAPDQIAAGWIAHMDPVYIWVSNKAAWRLMTDRGMAPPATGLSVANEWWLMIDAQLTTEFYGAIAPGMPEHALDLADLPIANVASGHAAHAAQAFVVMYAMASQVDPGLSGRDRALWLVDRARAYVPDTSKAADIIDFVRADFLANPDVNDWEATRDRIWERYQGSAAANGFKYRDWFESSVNFATTIMALLYGEGDYSRTVQIATLSGWDSDNPAATLGGLLGLMLGTQAIRDEFPGTPLSDRFNVQVTRNNLPDYLPDPQADDTLSMMADRMMPLVEEAILDAGGLADADDRLWLLPPLVTPSPPTASPVARLALRSANLGVLLAGGTVVPSVFAPSAPPVNYGYADPTLFSNAYEQDARGLEDLTRRQWYYSSQNHASSPGTPQWFAVTYSQPVEVHTVRLIEGDHFPYPTRTEADGGWFVDLEIDVLQGGSWVPVAFSGAEALDPIVPYQILHLELATPVIASGIRVRGHAGGADGFVTLSELDALSAPIAVARQTFDLNADDSIDVHDLYDWHAAPIDLNADRQADAADREYLERAVRWRERIDLESGRR